MEEKTEVEAFIDREAHIPDFVLHVMLAEDPVMSQFHLAGGLAGIRKIHELRQKVVGIYGFAVLTREIVNRLIVYGPFIEVGAGTGYWSYELQQAGCTSIATDISVPGTSSAFDSRYAYRHRTCFLDVQPISAQQAIREHPDKTLLTVWPETGEAWSYETLTAYTGATLIYVGAVERGRPQDDQFHDELERSWRLETRMNIPRFPGHHDAVFVYHRR
ncbi:MAG TPA: hypothetical protein VGM02_15590 [Acidobacteriaceae bacterium]|jgi:hypothetical protein